MQSFSGKYPYHKDPRQETLWASAGFESTEESLTLLDAPRRADWHLPTLTFKTYSCFFLLIDLVFYID